MRQILKKIALVVFGCAFALIMAEVILRLIPAPSSDVETINETQSLYEYDELLGWKMIPSSSARQKIEDFDVTYRINAQGFRGGNDRDIRKPAEVSRVGIFGDSFVFGVGLQEERTFAGLLANEGEYDVLNFGVSGYDPGQYLLTIENEGSKYDLDFVVMGLYVGNDIDDLPLAHVSQGQRYFKPYFTLASNGELEINNVPVPRGFAEGTRADTRLKQNFLTVALNWSLKLRTVQLLKNPLKEGLYPALERAGLVKSVEDHADTLALLQAILAKADATSSNRFGVIIIPSVNVKHNYLERRISEKIERSLDELGIPRVSMVPDVVAAEEALYFPHEGHWNEKGAELAAGKLHELLELMKARSEAGE